MSARHRICFVVSSDMTVKTFLAGHVAALARDYDISIAANVDNPAALRSFVPQAAVVPVSIERRIAPLADSCALAHLARLFRRERFALVHSVTPKAGLLCQLAGRAARIPVRLHTFTGQLWATRRGFRRALLKAADRAIAGLATEVLADSHSQRRFLIEEGVVAAERATVLASGSISGVDVSRFRPDQAAREQTRVAYGIPLDAVVFAFIGRLNRDKGVLELARAFAALQAACPSRLILVGPDEEGVCPHIARLAGPERVSFIGWTETPERFLAAADIFCLPSHREGFGTSVIEAAAAGIPAIGSAIYGITDAIAEGETGLLFPAGDVEALARHMLRLAQDVALRSLMGRRARERACREFAQERLTAALADYYARMLQRLSIPA